jgi:tetratricopeptide (TPR) repeat protein
MLQKRQYIFIVIISSFLFFPVLSRAQDHELNIVPYLKKIEEGNKDEVAAKLPELKKNYPNDPSVMYLEGLLTENGQQSVTIYDRIVKNYPKSKYADAALYRIYSYYYSLGMYSAAKEFLGKLETDYPHSPYIEIANKNIPPQDSVITNKRKVTEQKLPETNKSNEPKEQQNTPQYKYTIQAGAFSVSSNAESLKKDFIDAGYSSNIEEKNIGGTVFHIVYVGKFETEQQADDFLHILISKYNLQGRVIPIE